MDYLETLCFTLWKKSNFSTIGQKISITQKVRPIVALSRDDRLLESMQDFRIYGRVDHILRKKDNFFKEHWATHRNKEQDCTGIFTRTYRIYKKYKTIGNPKTTIHGRK